MADKEQAPQHINIELGEKEAEGIYSNLAIIRHSPAEFVIDFTRILPDHTCGVLGFGEIVFEGEV